MEGGFRKAGRRSPCCLLIKSDSNAAIKSDAADARAPG